MPTNSRPLAAAPEKTYRKLIEDISALYENARHSWARFAWETGRRIVEVEQGGGLRAEYGAGLLRTLSEDLTQRNGAGFSVNNLQSMRRYYLDNPKYQPADKLTWTNRVELMRVKDPRKRLALVKKAEREGLTKYDLRPLIKVANADGQPAKALPPLARPTDLRLNTFRPAKDEVAAAGTVPPGAVLVDCGFFVYRPVKKEDAAGLLTAAPSYTYAGRVVRVVDGDTLVVLIDAGFGSQVVEKLRLRGIDTPELGTPEGERAKKYVEKLLPAGTLVVLKSQKSTDLHGRFVVDLFYFDGDPRQNIPRPTGRASSSPGPGDNSITAEAIIESGEYLNQMLLDKGYAVRMQE